MRSVAAPDVVGLRQNLRRRKLVQWGLAYAAAAWGLLQGLEYVVESFGWPSHLRQVALLASLIGLPIVLVLAWYHGDRGEQRVSGVELTIITLLFLVGGGILWRHDSASTGQDPVAVTVAPPVAPAQSADLRPSIAVIPFDNRSRLEDDVFFVDGVHDDILTQLTKIGAMRVIARTSVEQFRDTKLTTREIGEKLGVTKILEGGVQRAGDRVRVTVQLIDAGSDAHLWAERYDRELTAANIFAIQSEVATAIAAALEATLTPAERARVDAVPTQNLQAWEHYQLGQQQLAKRSTAGFTAAVDHFAQAIAADPDFARAHAGLAATLIIASAYQSTLVITPKSRGLERAEEIIAKALALEPDLAEAHAALGLLHSERQNPEHAEVELSKAIELNPNYAPAYQWWSTELDFLGRHDEALHAAERALTLDPLSVIINVNLGGILEERGRLDEALAAYRRALNIDPTLPQAYIAISVLYAVRKGRFDQSIPYIERAAELDPGSVNAFSYRGYQYLNLGDEARAERFLNRALRLSPEGLQPLDWLATLHLHRGEPTKAQDYARRSFAMGPREGWSLKLLRNAELAAGKQSAARELYAQAVPELLDAAPPKVTWENFRAAIDLALVLQKGGEHERATYLLDRSEETIGTIARTTWNGCWLADAEIHALRGRKREALGALRAGEKARWRAFWRYYRDFEPNFASIRDEPEFKAVFADIERDIVAQRARLAARPKDAQLESTASKLPLSRPQIEHSISHAAARRSLSEAV